MDDCELKISTYSTTEIPCRGRLRTILGGLFVILFVAGCGGDQNKSLWQQIKSLGGEKNVLAIRVEKLEQENEQLHRQVKTLQTLDPNDRIAAIDALKKVALSHRSGLYDKNNDGKKETLMVYIEPTDSAGDRVKAAGSVSVQLWNLNAKDPHNALLKQWTVEPEKLKTCWAETIMTYYYRLSFPVGDIVKGDEKGLTVKVRFTDYFSGKILEDQRPVQ